MARRRVWRCGALAALLCALAALLAACGDDGSSSGEQPPPVATTSETRTAASPPPAPPDPPPPPVRGPFEPGGLTRIAAQLTTQLGHRPRVLEITLSEDFAHFEVADPDRPGEVNEYKWRDGVIEGPTPVMVGLPRDEVRQRLFPLYSLNLNAAATLARAARAQPIEGAQPTSMVIRSGRPFRTDVIWYVNVGGVREARQIRALANGRIYEVH